MSWASRASMRRSGTSIFGLPIVSTNRSLVFGETAFSQAGRSALSTSLTSIPSFRRTLLKRRKVDMNREFPDTISSPALQIASTALLIAAIPEPVTTASRPPVSRVIRCSRAWFVGLRSRW